MINACIKNALALEHALSVRTAADRGSFALALTRTGTSCALLSLRCETSSRALGDTKSIVELALGVRLQCSLLLLPPAAAPHGQTREHSDHDHFPTYAADGHHTSQTHHRFALSHHSSSHQLPATWEKRSPATHPQLSPCRKFNVTAPRCTATPRAPPKRHHHHRHANSCAPTFP